MFTLGAKSKNNLAGVHPFLVSIVERAIELTTQDFTVFEGCRTIERQKKLVAAGASKTMASMHIPQKDKFGTGSVYGHAVDLVPWIDGQPRWEWGPIYEIAAAMDAAATELGHAQRVCWGGVWDKYMVDYGGSADAVRKEQQAYNVRHVGRDFPDGPHFQVGRLG